MLWVIHRHRIKVENVAVCRHHQKWKGKIQTQHYRFHDLKCGKSFHFQFVSFGISFLFLHWIQRRLKSMDSNGNHSIHSQSTVRSLGEIVFHFFCFAFLRREWKTCALCYCKQVVQVCLAEDLQCTGWREIRRKIVVRSPWKCVIIQKKQQKFKYLFPKFRVFYRR